MMKLKTEAYLKELKMGDNPPVMLVYAAEGVQPTFRYCENGEEAIAMVEHWGETGELIHEEFDFKSGEILRITDYPDFVNWMTIDTQYSRDFREVEDRE